MARGDPATRGDLDDQRAELAALIATTDARAAEAERRAAAAEARADEAQEKADALEAQNAGLRKELEGARLDKVEREALRHYAAELRRQRDRVRGRA